MVRIAQDDQIEDEMCWFDKRFDLRSEERIGEVDRVEEIRDEDGFFFVKAGIYAYHISKSICSNTCHHIIFCLFNAKSLSQDNFINCPLLEVFFGPKVCPVKGPTTKTLSGEFGTSKASTSSLGSSG